MDVRASRIDFGRRGASRGGISSRAFLGILTEAGTGPARARPDNSQLLSRFPGRCAELCQTTEAALVFAAQVLRLVDREPRCDIGAVRC